MANDANLPGEMQTHMTESEFESELNQVLETLNADVRVALQRLVLKVPKNATALELMIFTNQDGDGQFNVCGSLDGPDLIVLSNQIADVSDLIQIRNTADGFSPPVPMVDPSDVDFDVNESILQCVSRWLQHVWQSADIVTTNVPVSIVGHNGVSVTMKKSCT